MYRLQRAIDRGTVSGDVSDIFYYDEITSELIIEHDARPRVNASIKVGNSNWWNTGEEYCWYVLSITEILSDTPNEVIFKNENNLEYTWFIE